MTLTLTTEAPPFDLPGVDGRNHSLDDYTDARRSQSSGRATTAPTCRPGKGA
jgi:hypothetical protein